MYSALLLLILLASLATLGSWLFSQYLSEQRRASALALGLGGTGFVVLLGATAVAVVATSASWQRWVPGFGATAPKTSVAAPVAVADLGSTEQWPATSCIKPLHASNTVPRRWFLDNDCERPIVVMLAWCDEARAICTAGSPRAAWRYESAGVILTSALARPNLHRMPEHGAPVTGTYALTEPDGSALRIRYLACYLGEPATAALTQDSMSQFRFERALDTDDCYSRVSSASQVAARSGQPPVVSYQ